ncbi:MAG TPA: hypothetical protein VLX92_15655 [Kofleriaceae bacterium]|nr:hypothetical protein [Kofleriaceae bacterium]
MMRVLVLVTAVACAACQDSSGPASPWTYEVPGSAELAGVTSFSTTLLVTVSPFDGGSDADDGIPQTIGWSDDCTVDVSVQNQYAQVPDACGYLYQALVSRVGAITAPVLPSCALPSGVATADLALGSSTVTFSPDSQAFELAIQAGGGDQPALTYTFTSDAAIPPPPAPGSEPCESPCVE